MYDAAAAATVAAATDAQHHDAGGDSGAAAASHPDDTSTGHMSATSDATPSDGGVQTPPKEIIIIDGNLPDVEALASGVKPGGLVFILDPDKDGVQQIADILKNNDLHDLSAIQIISHGLQGEIRLGTTVLTDANLANYSAAFGDIGSALAPGGDILLYGCDVGQGAAGLRFMADLAFATGADIAAASHGVGGGNAASWALDASTGAIQAVAPFTADTLNSYPYLLDTLSPGDIAIVSFNADDPDTFAFVALRDIGAGTVIRFTDQSWNGSAFSASGADSTITFTAASNIAAGTVIASSSAQFSGTLNLDSAGDTIYAYQGNVGSPTNFVTAIEFADGNNVFNGSLANTGLTAGTNAVAVAGDNGTYSGSTLGSAIALTGNISTSAYWVSDDLNRQTPFSGPFYLAPDVELWIAASGDGRGIVRVDSDGTIGGGLNSLNYVLLLNNATVNITTSGGTLTGQTLGHPTDIEIDTVHGKYFLIDSGSAVGNRVLEGSLAALLSNPMATQTLTALYSDALTNVGILGMEIDPEHSQVFYTYDNKLQRVAYDTASQTPTTLGSIGPQGSSFARQLAIDFVHGDVFISEIRLQAVFGNDLLTRNYIWHATGLTSTSGASSLTFTQLPFNPDDSQGANPNLNTVSGEGFPVENGAIFGLDVDAATRTLYFATSSISLDDDGNSNTPTVTQWGGIYKYIYTGNPTGTWSTVYQQSAGGAGPHNNFIDLVVDTATNRYYATTIGSSEVTAVWVGSLSGGTPTLFSNVTNTNAIGPQDLYLDHAPTSSVTSANPTYTETAGSPSAAGTAVALISAATVNDIDTAGFSHQLAGATVRITSGYLTGADHQDLLTVNGDADGIGTLASGISFSFNQATGILTLSGANTFANYQAALALVQFTTAGDNPTNYGANPTRTFAWSVTDGLLNSDEQTTTINIVGLNDAPDITVGGGNSATLARTETDAGLSGSGTLTVTDRDSLTVNNSVLGVSATGSTNGISNATLAGYLTVSPNPTINVPSTGTSATLTWTFDSAGQAFDYLRAGETLTLDYTIRATDSNNSNGGPGALTDDQHVIVTITGTNDAPSITAETNPGAVTEAGDASAQDIPAISGTLTISDKDIGDTLTASVTGNATALLNGGALPGGVNVAALVSSGAISFDPLTSNGGSQSINWTYNPTAANLDFLKVGDTLTITYTARVNDGTTNSGTQALVITINGTNDAPVITGETNPAAVNEALNASAQTFAGISGTVTATDLDIGDSLTGSVTGAGTARFNGSTTLPIGFDASALIAQGNVSFNAVTTDGGSKSLTWTYNAGAANLDFMTATDVLTIEYTAQVNDGHGNVGSQLITITINGTNDAPTLTATASNPSFTEGAGLGTQAGAVAVFSGAAASTIETGQTVTGLTFTVGGLVDGASERIFVDGTGITLGASSSGTTTGNGLGYSVTVGAGTATVVLTSGAGVSSGVINGIVDGIAYQNINTDNPTGGNRVFTLTQIKDNGGGSGANIDTRTLSIASTVAVTAVNDNPALSNVPASLLGAPGAPITVTGVTFADIDGNNLSEQATFSATAGNTFAASSGGGVTVTGSGTNSIVLSGTTTALTNFIAGGGLTFTATVNDTIHIVLDDQGHSPSGALTASADISAIVDLPPTSPDDIDAAPDTVAEGASAGTNVGITVLSTDPDGPTVTYSLTNDAGGRFAIDANGVVTVTALGATTIDYETAPGHAYTITVAATDNQGVSTTKDYSIAVTNVAPVTPVDNDGGVGGSVSEGAANGDAVGITALSTDVNGGAVTYSLSDDAGGRFQIDAAGVVTVANASLLNFEDNTSHTITVRASDPSGAFTEQTFTIAVTNVAPVTPVDNDGGVGGSVSEGAANGDAVGITALSTDVNGGAVTYSLSDDAGGRFQIDAAGVVTVANASLLNFEDNTSHTITVRAEDPSGAFTEQTFTIAVTNVAPVTPVDNDGGVGGSVSEGAANGDAVGITALSTDVNGGAVTYSLSDDAGGRFQIDAAGVVTVANASLLNFEDNTSHTITVRAEDPSGAFTEQTFTIAVTNVAPVTPVDNDGGVGGSVSEGAANGDAVGITALSTDVNGGAVTYSLSDDAGGRFQIDAAGVVTVANASLLNFEDNTSHTITVRAEDPSGAFTEQTFTIAVTNVAPVTPVDNDGGVGGSVSEGAANGDAVGITALSTDVNGGAVTYSLSDDAGGRFQIDAAGVVTVANASLLNFEDNTSHTITVRAEDPSGAFTEQTFTIAVTNVAPVTPVDNDGGVGGSVSEGAANGDAVGITALSTDVNGGAVTYSLSDDAGGRFQIDAAGVVTVANASLLNFEDNTSHTITVRAEDPSGAFTEQTFTIAVTNVAPVTPVDNDGGVGGSVSEGAANGDAVGITALSTDVNGGAVTYSLSDDAGGRFQIDAAGVVTVANASLLNFEDNTSHTITVRAEDPSGAFTEQTFTIAVTNVAPVATADSYSTNEDTPLVRNAAAGVQSNDGDVNGGTLISTLDSGPAHAASFILNADGSFSYTPVANYNGSDSFSYHVSDGTASSAVVTVSITVNAVNDAPVATIGSGYDGKENVSLNLKNTGLSVADVDAGGATVTATLTVSEGKLTVTAGTSGAVVAGSGTGTVTITGTLAQINALLNTNGTSTVSFLDSAHPPANKVTFTLAVNDGGNVGSGGALTGTAVATIDMKRADDGHRHRHDRDNDGPGDGGGGGHHGGNGSFGRFIGNFGLPGFSFFDIGSFHSVNFVRAGLSRPEFTASAGDAEIFAVQVSLVDLFAPLGGNVTEIFAKQANGDALPDWLKFDPLTGIFAGKTPAGLTGTITLEVVAQDSNGRQAITVFTVDLANGKVLARQGWQLPAPDKSGNPSAAAHKDLPNLRTAIALPAEFGGAVERHADRHHSHDGSAQGHDGENHKPLTGRAGLTDQLKNAGWRGMHAQRAALLDSVREHSASLH